MHNSILSVLAVLAVLLLAGGVTAHGTNASTSDHESTPANGSAAEWATWMEQHVIEHMGADAAAQIQDRMGMSYEEMGKHMASHQNGSMMNGRMMDGMMRGGMSGMGCH